MPPKRKSSTDEIQAKTENKKAKRETSSKVAASKRNAKSKDDSVVKSENTTLSGKIIIERQLSSNATLQKIFN